MRKFGMLLVGIVAFTACSATATPTPKVSTASTASTASAQIASVPAVTAVSTTAAATASTTPLRTPTVALTPTPKYAWGTDKEDVHVALAKGITGIIPARGSKGVHSVTIEQITIDAKSTNQFDDPGSGKIYVVFQITIQNTGTAQITLGEFKLRASDDVEYVQVFAAGLGDALTAFQTLTPGGKSQGVVVFAITQGTSPKFLSYDPNPFAKGDLYFDAP